MIGMFLMGMGIALFPAYYLGYNIRRMEEKERKLENDKNFK